MNISEIRESLEKEMAYLQNPEVIKCNNDDPLFNLCYDLDQLYAVFEEMGLKTRPFNTHMVISDFKFPIQLKNPRISRNTKGIIPFLKRILRIKNNSEKKKFFKNLQEKCSNTPYNLIPDSYSTFDDAWPWWILYFKKKNANRRYNLDSKIRYYPRNNNVFISYPTYGNMPPSGPPTRIPDMYQFTGFSIPMPPTISNNPMDYRRGDLEHLRNNGTSNPHDVPNNRPNRVTNISINNSIDQWINAIPREYYESDRDIRRTLSTD
jgi:hypothetical protein